MRPLHRHLAWVLPALVAAWYLRIVDPALLLSPTTPTGYDLGAHLLPLREAVFRLLPEGRIHGWSHAWFAGFPLYYFYFPLPALVTAALTAAVPFEVAVKLMSVAGLLTLPFGVLALAVGAGLHGWRAGVVAAVGASFALMQGYAFQGGNVASTLSGEFSYALSFTLSLAYLGVVARAARRGTGGRAGAVLLALTALSHVLTTFAVVLVSGIVAARFRRARLPVLVSWGVGFALSAVWSIPFLARWDWVPHIAWDMPRSVGDVLPVETWWLVPAAAVAAWGLVRRDRTGATDARDPVPGTLLAAMAAVAVGFWLFTPPNVFPGRLLPYAFVALHLLVGLGLVAGIDAVSGADGRPSWRTAPRPAVAAGLLAVVGLLGTNATRSTAPLAAWARYNYGGWEARGPAWDAYRALTAALDSLPLGRIHWEDDPGLAAFGTPHAPAMLPYWTGHQALGGLLIDSSPTAPVYLRIKDETSPGRGTQRAVRLPRPFETDFEAGFRHLAVMGVDRYLALTPETARRVALVPGVDPATRAGPGLIFDVPDAAAVRVLEEEPVVLDAGRDFRDAALEWFDRGGPERGRWLVEGGPAGWARVASVDEALAAAGSPPGPAASGVAVTEVVFAPEEVRFRTSAPGRPHLVAVSHFPNWRAEGAEGPWWAAPSLMVVVPTRSDVRLSFESTAVETFARTVSAGALLLVLGSFTLVRHLHTTTAVAETVRATRRTTESVPGENHGRREEDPA